MRQTKAPFNHLATNSLLLKITCLCWLGAKLLGWRMFTTYRTFPTAPALSILDNVPDVVQTILFLLSILCTVLVLVSGKNKMLLCALLVTEICLCLFDQNRWQPWEYLYLFIILIFIVNRRDEKLITAGVAFIVAATYVYSGLGKLNEGFLLTIWSKMLLHLFLKIPTRTAMQHWLLYGGYVLGVIELLAGIGLLFLKTRKLAATVLIIMHLFILAALGPFGLRYNIVVWPWNAAMIAYLYLIFLRKEIISFSPQSIFAGWNKLIFVCWGILPALNFIGCWDNYLSSGIYSGKLPRMLICIKDTAKCRPLQKYSRKDLLNTCGGEAIVDLQYWAMAETKIAPYPEIRVYKQIQQKLEKQFPDAGLTFVILVHGSWLMVHSQ